MKPLPDGWYHSESGINTVIHFRSFAEAFSFLTQVAFASEKHDHHPNINYHYDSVYLRLFTYTENKVTEKDYQLAEVIHQILQGYPNARISVQS
jgi:4a-hydroxytetrahydrobiopterin dehydratase